MEADLQAGYLVNLRITETKSGSANVIIVHGELSAEGVAELERVCREAADPLRLDLTELQRVDKNGRCLIRRLASEGVQLTGLSPYMKLLLKQ